MTKTNSIQELFQREISRKEFLQLLGVAFMGLIGVSAMMNNLKHTFESSTRTKKVGGYGHTPYGR